jgi:mevalonate pyrophosphate decarboxylase
LHLTTVMMLTGKVVLVDQADGKPAQVVVEDVRVENAKSCSDEQRKKVKELVTAYVKTGPELPKAADASAAAAAAAAAAPAKKP